MSLPAGIAEDVNMDMYSDADGLRMLREAAGWRPMRDTGWIAVTGDDRVRWLNGMVTNSVQALGPGEGAYTFLLNAQGRIQGDGTVWAEAGRLLIETDRAQVEPMMALLDRFIIMDDVELADLSDSMHGIELAGPGAVEVLAKAAGFDLRKDGDAAAALTRVSFPQEDGELVLITAYGPVVTKFELWTESLEVLGRLTEALQEVAPQCPAGSFELLRVLETRPRFGVDIRDRELPQETAQVRALHFSKGCYLGQEIVERIRSRGQVHRTFAQFVLRGAVPEAGAELRADGKPAGLLTSVALEDVDGERLALGYVRREAADRGMPLEYAGGVAEARDAHGASNR